MGIYHVPKDKFKQFYSAFSAVKNGEKTIPNKDAEILYNHGLLDPIITEGYDPKEMREVRLSGIGKVIEPDDLERLFLKLNHQY